VSIGKAEVIAMDDSPSDTVVFGRTVKLRDISTEQEIQYQLLGPYESDPDKGRISVTSPLGKALIGTRVGDEIRVRTPGGVQEFEILEIR
jgi:transcription elongation factor GreA